MLRIPVRPFTDDGGGLRMWPLHSFIPTENSFLKAQSNIEWRTKTDEEKRAQASAAELKSKKSYNTDSAQRDWVFISSWLSDTYLLIPELSQCVNVARITLAIVNSVFTTMDALLTMAMKSDSPVQLWMKSCLLQQRGCSFREFCGLSPAAGGLLPPLNCCRPLLQLQKESCNQHHHRPSKQPIPNRQVENRHYSLRYSLGCWRGSAVLSNIRIKMLLWIIREPMVSSRSFPFLLILLRWFYALGVPLG